MLEIKNLCKTYHPKNGVAVKALDDVSLRFPETGMVFLLGKSGSGKSTLLNVCGGLDSPSSGEVIVKGRSSKNFSQQDFDSYRNTFVGFIFQEYNILNEFTVEDNIALALELQNKPKDKAAVRKLLEEVDLEGYAKRKPNTLSGGQKQRIAIARALIKSPEIIMADEPSGALDSATGKQVFETLKKLSKDKLVLVVSHDREFAEQYGDRIIELKDGKVVSDVSKNLEKQRPLTQNIAATENVLCIKRGANLNEQDFAEIKRFLSSTDTDVIIATGEKEVQNFKKSNRITDAGEQEVFRQTAEQTAKTYRPEDSRFIKSKLPLRHAIKIGLSGLKSKPVRLFFTILLCTVAFVLFGLLSTMSFYNSEAAFKQSLQDSGLNRMRVNKEYQAQTTWYQNGTEEHTYLSVASAKFSPEELQSLTDTYGTDVLAGIQSYASYNIRSTTASYWSNAIEFVAYAATENSLRQSIQGSYPAKDDEICISSYMADVLLNCQIYDDKGETTDFKSHEDILGFRLTIHGESYTVTGIFDSGVLPEKFETLKGESRDEQLRYELEDTLRDGLHYAILTTEKTVNRFARYYGENYDRYLEYQRMAHSVVVNSDTQLPDYGNAIYDGISKLPKEAKIYTFNCDSTAFQGNGVLLNRNAFLDAVSNIYSEKMKDGYIEKYQRVLDLCAPLWEGGVWEYDEKEQTSKLVKYSAEEIEARWLQLLKAVKDQNVTMTVMAQPWDSSTNTFVGDKLELQVVGLFEMPEMTYPHDQLIYLSDEQAEAIWQEHKGFLEYYEDSTTKYENAEDALYTSAYLPYDGSEAQTEGYWQLYSALDFKEDDSRMSMDGTFVNNLRTIDSFVRDASQIFLYAGLVLAVFAALLFSNFISVSISQKRRDIGILRAVGAKSTDVFKIFFSESFFIALICIVISTVGTVFMTGFLNTTLAESLNASLLVFGVQSFGVLVGIAVLTAVIATFLPVYSAARKKPIDSIRSV